MTISYAITACNEHVELDRLLDQLSKHIRPEDEIVVQLDTTATDEVISVVEKYHLIRYYFPLNNDFASFKNNLKQHCKGDFIFQIDADELPSQMLMDILPQLLEVNPDNEVYLIPRVNTVEGLTQEHINKWGWRVNEKGWVNFPDYQWRIWKNIPEIKWINKVHERLDGFKSYAALPLDMGFEDCYLIHPKTIDRQERQNNYYNTL
jgi:glycosyltransferase involved in cell wall biosynthesis